MEGKRPRVDWEKIQSLEKPQKEAEIFDFGILEEKRFVLSRDPALKERIKKLHNAIKELKERHPEIISFGLVGSLTKGYASKESDIDGYLFLKEKEGMDRKEKTKEKKRLKELLKRRLKKKLNISKEQIIHISTELLSEKKVKDLLQEKTINAYDELSLLFILQAGSRDIEPYRKIVLDELENIENEHPGEGEEEWRKIINERLRNERLRFNIPYSKGAEVYEHLYPQTLKEGRRYFLRENI